MITKYPLGIMPLYLWKEERKQNLEQAIIRYVLADVPIPPEWITELEALKSELEPEQKEI